VTRRAAWRCALALVVAPTAALGQSAPDRFVTEGVRAYQDLQFDVAAGLLRRGVDGATPSALPPSDRARALTYLAASELFRNRRDSAAAAFRRLVLLDPRYRPDPLVFPPEVTTVFQQVLRETKAIVIVVAGDQTIEIGNAFFSAQLFASSSHAIQATLRYPDGALLRTLYDGPIGESLELRWDGLDAAGRPLEGGRLWLRVASRTPVGLVGRIVQLPLDVRALRADTLAWPPPPAQSLFQRERASGGPGLRALVGSLLLSGAVVALPTAVSGRSGAGTARFAVAAAIGITGGIGFAVRRPGRPLEANIRANQTLRADWQQRLAQVKAENEQRRRHARLVIHAGAAATIEAGGP